VTQYTYTAVPLDRAAAGAVRGTRSAQDERELRATLREQGLLPVSVRPNHALDALAASFASRKKLGRSERAWFFQTLAMLLGSRVPVADAVREMERLTPNPKLRAALAEIAAELRGGSALSAAVERRTGLASPAHAALLRSGERSAGLDRAADLVSRSIAAQDALRRALVSKLIYPAILLVVAVIVLWALGAFVVPRFAETLRQLGGQLPWQTALTLRLADAMVWAIPILTLVIGSAVAFREKLVPASVRRRFAERVLTTPIVGPLVWNRAAANVCQTMGAMIEGGADVLSAVDQAIDVTHHPVLRERLAAARRDVREGADLGKAFAEGEVLPSMLVTVVSVGLRSGELAEGLSRAGELAAEETETRSERLLTLLQPAVIALMAGVVAWVVYALIVGMMAMSEGVA